MKQETKEKKNEDLFRQIQKEVNKYVAEHGEKPTVRQIKKLFGYSDYNNAYPSTWLKIEGIKNLFEKISSKKGKKREKELIEWCKGYIATHGEEPTARQVKEAFNYRTFAFLNNYKIKNFIKTKKVYQIIK